MRNSSEPKLNSLLHRNNGRCRASAIVGLLFLCATAAPTATAQHKHRSESVPPAQSVESAAAQNPATPPTVGDREFVVQGRKFLIPNVLLVNQDGKKVRLYEDLIKDKTVAISFIFTRCTYVCPMNGALFSKIQNELGERLGENVFLISISMDPQADTPQELQKWGASFGRKTGWTLVTGQFDDIARVLKAFTGDAPGPRETHSSYFYVANDRTGTWDFMFGHMSSREVVEKLGELAQQRPSN
jgi:cytochrome oxidase Cu insertion factor (SCO1/SenC/PrrC family)